MMNQMGIELFNIPISLLRQYCFCPRIPFFMLVRELQPPRGNWVKQGVDFHEKVEKLMRRRDLSRLGLEGEWTVKTEVRLNDVELGLHGICDAVIQTSLGVVVPVEVKMRSVVSASQAEKIQLCAYGMLLERKLNQQVSTGFIMFDRSNKQLCVPFEEKLRNRVKVVLNSVREDCLRGLMPYSDASEAKCSQCEFSNFCADRF